MAVQQSIDFNVDEVEVSETHDHEVGNQLKDLLTPKLYSTFKIRAENIVQNAIRSTQERQKEQEQNTIHSILFKKQ